MRIINSALIIISLTLLPATFSTALAQSRRAETQPASTTQGGTATSSTSESEPETTETEPQVTAPAVSLVTADEDGFQFQSVDNGFHLRLRGEVQTDGRFFVNDAAETGTNTFYIRRVRAAFQGTLYSAFDFLLRADFGQGRVELIDAYIDANLSDAFSVQAGKMKAPVSLERLQSASDRKFIELSLPTGLLPNRDIGIQIHGNILNQHLQYQFGVFNGVVDGSSGDTDAFDSKDVAARLFAHPFRTSRVAALRGFGIGIAATTGTQYGDISASNLPSFRTPARQTFFRFRSGSDELTAAIADGRRTRISPQVYYYVGPFGLTTEYAFNTERLRLGSEATDLGTEAGHITASFLLTGEKATFRRQQPRRPFDSRRGQWGAFEVVGRIQTLRVDEDAFPVFASPEQSARSALGWGAGINWYLNSNIRFAVNFERTTFKAADGATALKPENLILSRVQLAF